MMHVCVCVYVCISIAYFTIVYLTIYSDCSTRIFPIECHIVNILTYVCYYYYYYCAVNARALQTGFVLGWAAADGGHDVLDDHYDDGENDFTHENRIVFMPYSQCVCSYALYVIISYSYITLLAPSRSIQVGTQRDWKLIYTVYVYTYIHALCGNTIRIYYYPAPTVLAYDLCITIIELYIHIIVIIVYGGRC